MKISQLTVDELLKHARAEKTEETTATMQIIKDAAIPYVQNYTGIPLTSSTEGEESLDDYEDLTIAVMVICCDMYDNRSLTVDKESANKVIESIMSLHPRNLVG